MPSSYVIGEHFEAFVKAQVQQGRYASASEVIREGLRVLEEREQFRAMKLEALRKAIQEGTDSGPAGELDIEDIKRRGRERLVAQKAR